MQPNTRVYTSVDTARRGFGKYNLHSHHPPSPASFKFFPIKIKDILFFKDSYITIQHISDNSLIFSPSSSDTFLSQTALHPNYTLYNLNVYKYSNQFNLDKSPGLISKYQYTLAITKIKNGYLLNTLSFPQKTAVFFKIYPLDSKVPATATINGKTFSDTLSLFDLSFTLYNSFNVRFVAYTAVYYLTPPPSILFTFFSFSSLIYKTSPQFPLYLPQFHSFSTPLYQTNLSQSISLSLNTIPSKLIYQTLAPLLPSFPISSTAKLIYTSSLSIPHILKLSSISHLIHSVNFGTSLSVTNQTLFAYLLYISSPRFSLSPSVEARASSIIKANIESTTNLYIYYNSLRPKLYISHPPVNSLLIFHTYPLSTPLSLSVSATASSSSIASSSITFSTASSSLAKLLYSTDLIKSLIVEHSTNANLVLSTTLVYTLKITTLNSILTINITSFLDSSLVIKADVESEVSLVVKATAGPLLSYSTSLSFGISAQLEALSSYTSSLSPLLNTSLNSSGNLVYNATASLLINIYPSFNTLKSTLRIESQSISASLVHSSDTNSTLLIQSLIGGVSLIHNSVLLSNLSLSANWDNTLSIQALLTPSLLLSSIGEANLVYEGGIEHNLVIYKDNNVFSIRLGGNAEANLIYGVPLEFLLTIPVIIEAEREGEYVAMFISSKLVIVFME